MRNTIAHPEWLQSATANGVTTYDLTEPGPGRVRHPSLKQVVPQ
jgi:NTE family protein